jgi:hypothetical protein
VIRLGLPSARRISPSGVPKMPWAPLSIGRQRWNHRALYFEAVILKVISPSLLAAQAQMLSAARMAHMRSPLRV